MPHLTSGFPAAEGVGPPPEDQRMLAPPHPSRGVAPFADAAMGLLVAAFPWGLRGSVVSAGPRRHTPGSLSE